MSDALARAITKASAAGRGGARLRTGVVAATGPLTITLDGGTVAANYITSYTPTVSDVVAVIVDGNRVLVLGSTS